MAEDEDRVQRAIERLREEINTELAVVKPEAIARLGEAYYAGDDRNFDSHITGIALQRLERAGEIFTSPPVATKGDYQVSTIQPTDQRLRRTAVADAAARKRALYARYLSWAGSTIRHPHGLIGPAGEEAVRRGIIASAALQPASPDAGPVSRILDTTLPGPADSGGFMNVIVKGIPQPPVTVLIEVKSVREWIYPSSSEIFQVLFKCIILKQVQPDVPVVPILVCRRAQETSFYMASQLGFFIIDMGAQFVGTTVTEPAMLEVRNELAFGDLHLGTGPSLRVRDRLPKLGPYINEYAETWAATAEDPALTEPLSKLRHSLPPHERANLLNDVRNANRANGGDGGW